MAGVTPSIMECRNYSVQDIMNIYGVGEESVRNFIKKHQKNNDFRVFMVGKYGGTEQPHWRMSCLRI